jgi:hypothetical protein
VSAAGAVLEPSGIAVSNHGGDPAVASDGTNYLVVWPDSRSGTSSDIYGARVSAAGAVLDGSGIAVSTADNYQMDPAVTYDGTNYLVVWADRRSGTDWDIYGARVSAAGAVLDGSGIAVSTAANHQSHPAVAYGGTNNLVVWKDYRSATDCFEIYAPCRCDVYGARVSAAGAVLDGSGLPVATSVLDEEHARDWPPAIASDGRGRTLVAYVRKAPESPYDGAIRVMARFVTTSAALTVAKAGSGNGTVAANIPGTIDCGVRCSAWFDPPAEVTLTATPSAGSWFEGWSGACSGTRDCVLTMDSAKEVTASFSAVATYSLTVNTAGNGQGTVTTPDTEPDVSCSANAGTCVANAPRQSTVTLQAQPSADSIVASWSGCTPSADKLTCTVTMAGARSVTATFQPATYVLTARANALYGATGTLSTTDAAPTISCPTGAGPCTGSAANGASVTLHAQPGANSLVSSWSPGCTPSADKLTCTLTMMGPRSVSVTFQPRTYVLTASANGTFGATGTVSTTDTAPPISCTTGAGPCTGSATNGATVTLRAQPGAGSLVASWSGCAPSPDKLTCTVAMTGAKSVAATFQPATYALTARATGLYGATGTVSTTDTAPPISCATGAGPCTGSAANGATVTLRAGAGAGSLVASWSGCTPSADKLTCTVAMTWAKSVTANFQPATYVLTASANGAFGATGTVSTTDTAPPISCATGVGACTGSAANGATVTLRAEPGAGSLVSAWSGCTPSADKLTCTLTMTAARSVTATFQPTIYVLTATANGLSGATGTVSTTDTAPAISCATGADPCTGSVANGATVTLRAEPGAGSFVYSWSGCTPSADKLTCALTMTSARSVAATFQSTPAVVSSSP